MNKEITNAGIIERGRIINKNNNEYRVASLDRDGIETGWIKSATNVEFQMNDYVYFVSFRDGTGTIFCQFSI